MRVTEEIHSELNILDALQSEDHYEQTLVRTDVVSSVREQIAAPIGSDISSMSLGCRCAIPKHILDAAQRRREALQLEDPEKYADMQRAMQAPVSEEISLQFAELKLSGLRGHAG